MLSRWVLYLGITATFINSRLGMPAVYPHEPSYSLNPEAPNDPKSILGKLGGAIKKGASRVGKAIGKEFGGESSGIIEKGAKGIIGLIRSARKKGGKSRGPGKSGRDRGSIGRGPGKGGKSRGAKTRGPDKSGRDRGSKDRSPGKSARDPSGSKDKKREGGRSEREKPGSSGRKSSGKRPKKGNS